MLCPDPVSLVVLSNDKLPKGMYKHLTVNSFSRWRHKTLLTLFAKEKEIGEQRKLTMKVKPHKKVQYTGPLYVFIDGYSFSASSLVSSYIRDQDRALFIGEETGGGKYGTNALSTPYLTLPNTEVRVRMPLWQLKQMVAGDNQGRGIFPDVSSSWTIEDVLMRNDPELEKLLELKMKFLKEKSQN